MTTTPPSPGETAWLVEAGPHRRLHPFDTGVILMSHPVAFSMLTCEGVPFRQTGGHLTYVLADFCRAHPAKVAATVRALIAVGTEGSTLQDDQAYNALILAELDAQARVGGRCHDNHAT